jgi:hypothetical protein
MVQEPNNLDSNDAESASASVLQSREELKIQDGYCGSTATICAYATLMVLASDSRSVAGPVQTPPQKRR